ncbi:hypothetical protein Tco_0163315 [Tanacetum coccineum]
MKLKSELIKTRVSEERRGVAGKGQRRCLMVVTKTGQQLRLRFGTDHEVKYVFSEMVSVKGPPFKDLNGGR